VVRFGRPNLPDGDRLQGGESRRRRCCLRFDAHITRLSGRLTCAVDLWTNVHVGLLVSAFNAFGE
jgi:hypothetical protein